MGELVRVIFLARLSTAMHLLIGSGVTIMKAIELSRQMVTFYPINCSLENAAKSILAGKTLSSGLASFPIYDIQMISLLQMSEEVNKVAEVFGKLAKNYEADIEHKTKILGTLLEPALILFLGAFIAVLLVAMYLPLFRMGNTVY